MAKKKQPLSLELPDDGSIPDFLKVKNRKPLTQEQQQKLDQSQATRLQQQDAKRDYTLPRGIEPEGERMLRAAQASKEERKQERVAARAVARAARPSRPSRDGLISIAVIATELGITAKEARGILRSLKVAKPAAGWVFTDMEAGLIKEQLKSGAKVVKTKTGTPRKTSPLPPPSETTWSKSPSDKAKNTRIHKKVAEQVARKEQAAAESKAKLTTTLKKGKRK